MRNEHLYLYSLTLDCQFFLNIEFSKKKKKKAVSLERSDQLETWIYAVKLRFTDFICYKKILYKQVTSVNFPNFRCDNFFFLNIDLQKLMYLQTGSSNYFETFTECVKMHCTHFVFNSIKSSVAAS